MKALALLAAFLALPAIAADHDPAYYQRTGTKPPLAVDGFLGPSISYGHDLGVGFHGGPFFKKAELLVLFGVEAVKIDGQSGTATYDPDRWHDLAAAMHRPVAVPYQTSNQTVPVWSVNFLFRVTKPR